MANGIRSSSRHGARRNYDSRRDGSLVVVAEAAPIGGRANDQLLHDAADEFPPP
ncbi:hypothetical protein ACPZ19_49530 [Amycolatopsis lurida]